MSGIWLGLALVAGAWLGWSGVVGVVGLGALAIVAGGASTARITLIALFALLGCVRVYEPMQDHAPLSAELDFDAPFRVVSRPVDNGRSQLFALETTISEEPTQLCASAPSAPMVSYDDLVRISGVVTWRDDVGDNFAGYLKSRGCDGFLQVDSLKIVDLGDGVVRRFDSVRTSLNAAIHDAAPGDSGALLAGLVTGDDAALPSDRRDDFIVTGTSHITAVSGSNLALIVAMLSVAGQGAGVGKRWWWLGGIAAILWLYVGVIGFSPPALRAALVASLALCAIWIGRRPDFVTLSLLVAAAEVIIRPGDFNSLAFRLSTTASIALVLALSGRTPGDWRGWIGASIFATAATQAATSVFLIPIFERFPVYSIPANLVIAPLSSLAFPISLLAGLVGLVSPTLARAIATPASWISSAILEVAAFFADLPGAGAGSHIGGLIPPLVWAAIAVGAVGAISKECRGGIVRAVQELQSADSVTRHKLVAAAGGAVAGMLLGIAAR